MARFVDVEALQKTIKVLSGPKALTPRQIAEKVGISKPVVYRMIDRLRDAGVRIEISIVRDGLRGPASKAYRIIK